MPSQRNKTKIVLLGGLGLIGKTLASGLSNKYDVLIADVEEDAPELEHPYLHIDVSCLSQLMERLPQHTEVIVNLTALAEMESVVGTAQFTAMENVYVTGSYNVFLAAQNLNIPKVVYASTNHVSGFYEENGRSILGREISVNDYPLANNVYGAMKLCGEQFGRLLSSRSNLSVICLRIGTVVDDEYSFLLRNDRGRRTILSKTDLVDIFDKSIASDVHFGLYFAVSDNPEKPWSIQEAISELGYSPRKNSEVILNLGRQQT